MTRLRCDVAVVGCGVAGLSAALSALELGRSVILLERAPKEDRGGNTRWTEALLRVAASGEASPDFEQGYLISPGYHLLPEFVEAAGTPYNSWPTLVKALPFVDPELLESFIKGIPAGLKWLNGHGIKLSETSFPLVPPFPPLISISGGGLALVETLCAKIEQLGGRILYETTATRLSQDENNLLTGVVATDNSNASVIITAPNVILASGGFEGNSAMMAQYLGATSKFMRPIARGGWHNKGEGIRMALASGAAHAGDYAGCHCEPVDPRSNVAEALVNAFPLGIVVNSLGHRFFDEASSDPAFIQEGPCEAIREQPGGIGHFIYDAKLDEIPSWRRAIRSDQPPVLAGTLDELAQEIGVPPTALAKTVAEFNAGCADGPINMERLDGRCTHGVAPRKSNFARSISKPPFGSYPMISAIVFTFGGLRVTKDAQVVNASGVVIPGLYAAGETVGIFYGVYLPATSMLRGLVFGRRAGTHAATSALAAHV